MMTHRLCCYSLLFSLLMICLDLHVASFEVTETNDTAVRCQNQHFILSRNDTLSIRTHKNETCDSVVSSSYNYGITVKVLWLPSWSIFDYFTMEESGADCLNQSFGWIGFTEAEPCTIVLNCSEIHINIRTSSILEIQERSMFASTYNLEYVKQFDAVNIHTYENLKFHQCKNVHIIDKIYQIPYYEIPYVTLQEGYPSFQITLINDPYFKQDELPGFDLDLPDDILLAEFPECPVSCLCTLGFQMLIIDCPDAYDYRKNILIVGGSPASFLTNSTAIDLSDRQLTHIEPQCFLNLSDVIILLLSRNKLTTIGPGIFEGLENIHTVDLSFNQISSIETGSFSHLYKLKRLLLNVNKLQYISHSWFDGVQVLYLGGNTIKEVEPDMFSHMQGLKVLSYPDCHLSQLRNLPNELLLLDITSNIFSSLPTNLPKNLTHLSVSNNHLFLMNQTILYDKSTLVSLVLSHNNISVIPSDLFSHLYTLKRLYLHSNTLEKLQINLFDKLMKLEILTLYNNIIGSLQSGIFRNCHQLKELWLYDNTLNVIQSGLFNSLIKLEILGLSNNSIETLPSGVFRDLHQLLQLYLMGNKLKVVQSNIFNNLTKLEVLSLYENNIESLPSGVFKNLHQLQELWLYRNKLNVIQSGLFNSLAKLARLHLNENIIESLPSGVFKGLHQLLELYLNGNKLKVIQSDLFNSLTKLEILGLNENNIESLPSGVFKGLHQLEVLDLFDNKLHVIQTDLFSGLTKLEVLSLNTNEIESLPSTLFTDLKSLKELHLFENKLIEIPKDVFHQFGGMPLQLLNINSNNMIRLYPYQFANLTDLIVLNLQNNEFKEIHNKALSGLPKLKYLNLDYNSLTKLTKHSFEGLHLQNNSYITVDNSATCCFLEMKSQSQCAPRNKKSPYLTCKQLLPSTAVKCCAWIFGFCALFANIAVFIWGCEKMISKSVDNKQVKQVVFITNLALADLLMGVYLLVIASVDQYYSEYFPSVAKHWRNSALCKFAGFLSILSSEASLLFLTLIAVDRLWAFRKIFIIHKLFGKITQVLMTTFAWVTAFSLSIVTIFLQDDNLYQFSDVCIGLPLAKTKKYEENYDNISISYNFDRPDDILLLQTFTIIGSKLENYFSIGLFLGFNFLLCLLIAICYILLFVYICKSGFSLLKTDLKMSIKMGAVTLTDLMCWLPIVILGILAQTGVKELPPELFPWITAFTLPINSILNPFLYATVDRVSNHFVDRLRPNCYIEMETML
ncbi:uncharacterized protein [Amphiura filiformis]|uniref:uncharacterized protein n=1 Tax=Amphiura filiformis TaxID=82378 RepID=UPI003B20E18E